MEGGCLARVTAVTQYFSYVVSWELELARRRFLEEGVVGVEAIAWRLVSDKQFS